MIRRWWIVALVSLSILTFELIEYWPITQGVDGHFLIETIILSILLPVCTGLALSGLAASRLELAWSVYYQSLKSNLDVQLYNAHSHLELAEVFLQFVRVVAPLVAGTVYRYDQHTRSYKTILNWALSKDSNFSDMPPQCSAGTGCPLLIGDTGGDGMMLHPCCDPAIARASEVVSSFCMPFLFSDAPVAGTRLYFQRGSSPSPEQIRLLKEVLPMLASAFERAELEYQMKTRDEHFTVEQQRIARDVHDSLGHSLAYLRLRLDQMSMESEKITTKVLQKEVETLRDVAKDAYDQMRGILVALAPEDNSDLNNTLLQYLDTIRPRSSFKINLSTQGRPIILPPNVQHHIFLIIREALTNIEKHAHAKEAWLDLNWQESDVEIDLRDDGIGFDVALKTQNGHFGLKNMQERAMQMNGRLSIASQPGQGTQIILYVPYRDEP